MANKPVNPGHYSESSTPLLCAIDWPNVLLSVAASCDWSQRQLAAKLGISAQYFYDVVHGKRPLSLPLRFKVASLAGWAKTPELVAACLPDDASAAFDAWSDHVRFSETAVPILYLPYDLTMLASFNLLNKSKR